MLRSSQWKYCTETNMQIPKVMGRNSIGRFLFIFACLCASVFFYIFLRKLDLILEKEDRSIDITKQFEDRKDMDLTFVGGMPRTGTTLMRTMLDSHPHIKCGQETWVIQEILNIRATWTGDTGLIARLSQAGVYPTALDNAIAQFMLEIIIGHNPPTKHYCNKDPYTHMHTKYLHQLFPNAKFILMLRDARAFAHSVISRGVKIREYDITSYRDVITRWNSQIRPMYTQCLELTEEFCLPVHYEQLVLKPVSTTKRIFEFLDIPWSSAILHHEDHLNETALGKLEYSTDQVSKPLYLDALTSWFDKIPKDVERDMARIAPMLSLLEYDPNDPKPNYGEPDEFVKKKLKQEEALKAIRKS